ncbi:MAG TPA: hypothetical protein VMJ72_02725 [Candidatus Paceibacterota bacterium]|nr:hypothetical protein [Candidatus Paceibacterota bacterium]
MSDIDRQNQLLAEVLEAASREFASWPKWKQDEARADFEEREEPHPTPDDDMLD